MGRVCRVPGALGSLTLWPYWFALQLLRRLERENARLQAALEWRRRELVFWRWMVRKPFHPPPVPPLPSPPLV